MRRIIWTGLLALVTTAAHAELTPAEKAMLDRINSDPSLKAEALARLSTTAKPIVRKQQPKPAKSMAAKAIGESARGMERPLVHPQYSKCAGFQFLLRQDWKDFNLLECPGPTADAAGAQISFTDDLANRNRIWAIDGTVAIVYNSLMDPYEWWQPTYLNFGAYASIDRSFNSAAAFTSSDVDKLAYGAFAQAGYTSQQLQSFFRARGAIVENHIKNTSSANFNAEYIPVYDPLYIHYPTPAFLGYVLRFDPMLFVRYSEVTGKNQILAFNNRTEALRVGAEATLRLLPGLGAGDSTPLRAALTYRWAEEIYTGRKLSWFQTEITYNIDPTGHLAVGFSYKRGNDEDTGVFANIYRLGLTGKI